MELVFIVNGATQRTTRTDANKSIADSVKFLTAVFTVTGAFTEELANSHGYYALDWVNPPSEEGYYPAYTLVGNRIKMEWIAE